MRVCSSLDSETILQLVRSTGVVHPQVQTGGAARVANQYQGTSRGGEAPPYTPITLSLSPATSAINRRKSIKQTILSAVPKLLP